MTMNRPIIAFIRLNNEIMIFCVLDVSSNVLVNYHHVLVINLHQLLLDTQIYDQFGPTFTENVSISIQIGGKDYPICVFQICTKFLNFLPPI